MLTHLLAFLLIVDVLRLWRRAVSYPHLEEVAEHLYAPALLHEFTCIPAPGVHVPQDVIWRAAQWADDEGVLVVDLIPEGWDAPELLSLLQVAHPVDYAQKPFAKGMTAGVAVLVHDSILQRLPAPVPKDDLLSWFQFAHTLKRYTPWESALVIATGWTHDPPSFKDQSKQRLLLKKIYGQGVEQMKWASPIIWWILGYSIYLNPIYGGSVFLLWLLQPMFILSRQAFKARWVHYIFSRPVTDFLRWCKLWGPIAEDNNTPLDPESLRPVYDELLKEGTERFFEAPRVSCPLCEARALSEHLTLPDLYQGKPGVFRLDRCHECGHIFQNPRLNIEGLEFYYRDFYDGLGEDGMDMIFGASESSYRQRVSMIRAHGTPQRWLDVGGGHGHFALIARHLLPQTTFDVLDLSKSVEIAQQRGWCEEGIRGLFPELASQLSGYDGISMSHYLEHTTDPKAEIEAAAKVLKEGGLLMIEVPDPESKLGKYLKGWWLPWFQPQHLHFVSVGNLEKLCEAHGFEVMTVDRSQAHQSVDLFFAVLILIQRLAPDRSRPWTSKGGVLIQLWRVGVIICMFPLICLGVLLDRMVRPLFTRPLWSNTYRLLARKLHPNE